jgi:hypothetical protein
MLLIHLFSLAQKLGLLLLKVSLQLTEVGSQLFNFIFLFFVLGFQILDFCIELSFENQLNLFLSI